MLSRFFFLVCLREVCCELKEGGRKPLLRHFFRKGKRRVGELKRNGEECREVKKKGEGKESFLLFERCNPRTLLVLYFRFFPFIYCVCKSFFVKRSYE